MTYRVEMSDRANEDLDSVAGYVLPRAPLQGAAWMVRLEDAIAALAEFPEAHPLAPERPSVRGEVIRHLLYGTKPHIYCILFRVDDSKQTVFVLTIRRGSRLPATGL